MNASTDTPDVADEDEGTGFPALRTWRGVYCAVIGIFVTWVILLTALSRAFR
jgi:hypothetical protein